MLFTMNEISKAVEFYNVNGWVGIDKFLDPETCDQFIQNADKVRSSLGDPSHKPIINIHQHSDYFLRTSCGPAYQEVIKRFIGDNISLLQTQLFFGVPGTPGFSIHQDNSFVKAEPAEAFITSWLALDPVSKENGSIFVYPGLHKHGIFPRQKKSIDTLNENALASAQTEEVILPEDCPKPFLIEAPRGTLVLLHSQIPHGSYNNESSGNRHVYLSNYLATGKPFFSGTDGKRVELCL